MYYPLTGRNYLLKKQIEEHGYGLYSYVLLLKKPQNQNEFNRYLRLFTAFYTCINPARDYLEMGLSKQEINVTYWPMRIKESKLDQITEEEENSNWKFFIDKYDYPRSRLILSRIKGLSGPGPFIVSYNTPLGVPNKRFQVARKEMLIFDLSKVHEHLFDDLFLLYQEKVREGPETWKEKFDIKEIRIRCRSILKDQADNIIYLATFLKDFFG
jgi:hypothetical protein